MDVVYGITPAPCPLGGDAPNQVTTGSLYWFTICYWLVGAFFIPKINLKKVLVMVFAIVLPMYPFMERMQPASLPSQGVDPNALVSVAFVPFHSRTAPNVDGT